MEFTPRLMQILFLLLNTVEPIPAGKLAQQLQISKRTIFRELDHVDVQLEKYDLKLNRKSGIGFELEGSLESKYKLLQDLKSSDHFDPRNREKRQQKLLLAMLQEDELHKLFYYADLLQVSEPTISKDLDVMEEWLRKQNVMLLKRAGVGVGLAYEEEDFRKALLAYKVRYQDQTFLPQDIFERVKRIIEISDDMAVKILTSHSLESFTLYTAISVWRILNGKIVTESPNIEEIPQENRRFIQKLVRMLEEEFQVFIGRNEEYNLYIYLQGCRLQYVKSDGARIYVGQEEINVKNMVYEMANIFDPALAYELNTDKDFVEGMIAHLQPTITRLLHNMSVKNPMLDQIRVTYPEVFEKASKAAKVMERMISCRMPEDEIGFLALHFGGAMMRLENKKRSRHVVDVGVICSSGIGISILLSSKLKHHFEDKIRVEVLNNQNNSLKELDFLISTFPIETELEYVCVNPMLEAEDLDKIDELVEKYAYQKKKAVVHKKKNANVQEAMMITKEIHSIIQSFSFQRLPADIEFDMALKIISTFFDEDIKKAEQIYRGFHKREALSTQVIEEFEIVFLHAQTTVVEESKFMVVLPKGEYFSNAYFKKTRAIIVMLVPKDDPRRTLAISSVSSRIFEEEEFLEEIKTGKEEIVFKKIGETLEDYFNEYLRIMYDQNN